MSHNEPWEEARALREELKKTTLELARLKQALHDVRLSIKDAGASEELWLSDSIPSQTLYDFITKVLAS